MPRKKRTIIEENIPDTAGEITDDVSDFDVALESVEDIEALRDVMDRFGQSGELLKVYRASGEYCFQSENVNEDFIQKNFGGGEYRLRVFIGGKYRKTIEVKLAAPPASENGNGNGNFNAEHRHMDFLEKLVLAQIAGGSNNRGPSITDLTNALANIDSLRGKQESGMDLFQKGMTFAKEIYDSKPSGIGDWKSEVVGAVKESIPVIGSLIAAKTGGPSMPTINPQAQANQIVTANPDQQVAMMKQGIAFLKKKCMSGLEPDFIVEWVENNAEDYQPLIHMVLNLPFEKFVEIDAELNAEPFKQWFTELFNGLRSAFVPANPVDVGTSGKLGNNSDTGNDGKSSKDAKRKSA